MYGSGWGAFQGLIQDQDRCFGPHIGRARQRFIQHGGGCIPGAGRFDDVTLRRDDVDRRAPEIYRKLTTNGGLYEKSAVKKLI